MCHKLKEPGDIDILLDTLHDDQIREYYHRKWYPECFYLLAMLDMVSKENNFPLCAEYDDLRAQKQTDVIYPSGVVALSVAHKSEKPKQKVLI